jgi:hypothetical protein
MDQPGSSTLTCPCNSGIREFLGMHKYVVRQEHDELWWVSLQEKKLYFYTTEEEARSAALALARNASQSGTQATVLLLPSDTRVEVQDTRKPRRFTGL